MIRAVIVEDESYMQEEIKSRLRDFFLEEVAVVDQAFNVNDGIVSLETYKPDLLFLDVYLPDGTGFDLLQKSKFKDFNVIFITGYDTNAIKAIRVGALDYILKPIDDDEFKEAVTKAIAPQNRKNRSLDTSASVSQNHFSGIENKRIVLKTLDNIYSVVLDDILYCQSEGNYTTVYLQDERILLSKHIKKIEELLPPTLFVRCHQSYLVNKEHVRKFNKRGYLLMTNEMEIPVSGRRREHTLQSIFK